MSPKPPTIYSIVARTNDFNWMDGTEKEYNRKRGAFLWESERAEPLSLRNDLTKDTYFASLLWMDVLAVVRLLHSLDSAGGEHAVGIYIYTWWLLSKMRPTESLIYYLSHSKLKAALPKCAHTQTDSGPTDRPTGVSATARLLSEIKS